MSDTKTYKVTNPETLFVAGQRVVDGKVRLSEDAAKYDVLAGVIEPPVEAPSKAPRTAVEG